MSSDLSSDALTGWVSLSDLSSVAPTDWLSLPASALSFDTSSSVTEAVLSGWASSDKCEAIDEKTAEYAKLQSSPEAAAKRGYVDTIISAESARKQLLYAFEMLY